MRWIESKKSGAWRAEGSGQQPSWTEADAEGIRQEGKLGEAARWREKDGLHGEGEGLAVSKR